MKQIGIIFSLLLILGCSAPQQKQSIHGNTMGTTYNITYIGPTIEQAIIDSVLQVVNQSMSTYIPSSTISKLNQSTGLTIDLKNDAHFEYVYQCAKVLAVASKGAFDYTVMPIVNHYGFGFEKQKETALEEWEAFIGHDKIEMKADNINMQFIKADPRVQIDFSAIAKGYGVDVVAQLLDEKGIHRYLVEIGGEVKCKGKNNRAQYWSLGIDKPTGQQEEGFQEILRLKDKSMATSGNYRNIRVVDGKQYSHTIDPRIGMPDQSDILSATVLHESCMFADAYATALMVLGMDEVMPFIQQEKLEVYLVYDDQGTSKVYSTIKH